MLSNFDARRCGTLCFCVIFRGGISAAAEEDDEEEDELVVVINRFVHGDENNEELAVNRLVTRGRFLANKFASIIVFQSNECFSICKLPTNTNPIIDVVGLVMIVQDW